VSPSIRFSESVIELTLLHSNGFRQLKTRQLYPLDAMAARMEGRFRGTQEKLQDACARLEWTIQAYGPKGTSEGRFDALLLLGRKIEASILSLSNEI
jgi:hypothetical protein